MSQSTGPTSCDVYQTCDPTYLRQLKAEAGMDTHVLAKTACMSLAQVRELEQGTETGVFYSVSIRRQAYKRLLLILGAEPPRAEPIDVPLPARQEHQAQLHNLDQIAAMSRLPSMVQSPWAPLVSLLRLLMQHKQVIAAGGLLVVAAVLLVANWPQSGAKAIVATVSEAASVASQVASESASAVEHVLAKPEQAPAASAVQAAVAASAVSTPAPVVAHAASCAYSAEALPQVMPMVASKPGQYVHFVSTANIELCIVDGNKQITSLTLKAGESRSIYGASPWQVSSANLNKVQVFFQGWRVNLPSDNTQRMTLIEKTNSP